MKTKKIVISIICGAVLSSSLLVTLPEISSASEKNTTKYMVGNSEVFDPNMEISEKELKDFGFTDNEILQFNNYQSSSLLVNNGLVENTSLQERGKFTWAVKIIKKGINKLPTRVRDLIMGVGIGKILQYVEHYTGVLEDGIYYGCKKAGMNHFSANLVAKTIMLVCF